MRTYAEVARDRQAAEDRKAAALSETREITVRLHDENRTANDGEAERLARLERAFRRPPRKRTDCKRRSAPWSKTSTRTIPRTGSNTRRRRTRRPSGQHRHAGRRPPGDRRPGALQAAPTDAAERAERLMGSRHAAEQSIARAGPPPTGDPAYNRAFMPCSPTRPAGTSSGRPGGRRLPQACEEMRAYGEPDRQRRRVSWSRPPGPRDHPVQRRHDQRHAQGRRASSRQRPSRGRASRASAPRPSGRSRTRRPPRPRRSSPPSRSRSTSRAPSRRSRSRSAWTRSASSRSSRVLVDAVDRLQATGYTTGPRHDGPDRRRHRPHRRRERDQRHRLGGARRRRPDVPAGRPPGAVQRQRGLHVPHRDHQPARPAGDDRRDARLPGGRRRAAAEQAADREQRHGRRHRRRRDREQLLPDLRRLQRVLHRGPDRDQPGDHPEPDGRQLPPDRLAGRATSGPGPAATCPRSTPSACSTSRRRPSHDADASSGHTPAGAGSRTTGRPATCRRSAATSSVFDQWTTIETVREGKFMERVARGAFTRPSPATGTPCASCSTTARTRRSGRSRSGRSPCWRGRAGRLLRGAAPRHQLQPRPDPRPPAGVYGSSFRFTVTGEDFEPRAKRSTCNPDAIPERTSVGRQLLEMGPVVFPAYPGATAGVRSLTDQFG